MKCEACTRGDHANCGMQSWCDCEDERDGDPYPFDTGLPDEDERDYFEEVDDQFSDRSAQRRSEKETKSVRP